MENEKKLAKPEEEQLEQAAGGSLADSIGDISNGQSNQNNNWSNSHNKLPTVEEALNNQTVEPKFPNHNGLPDISLPKDIGDM